MKQEGTKWKSRLFVGLMASAMVVVTVLPGNVFAKALADGNEPVVQTEPNGTPLTKEYLDGLSPYNNLYELPAGDYYLTGDLDLTNKISIFKGDTTIDLNGYVISGDARNSSLIEASSNLTIIDSRPDAVHKFDRPSGNGVWTRNEESGEVEVHGGVFAGHEKTLYNEASPSYGAAIFCSGSYGQENHSLNIQGGNYIGNSATIGAAVYGNYYDVTINHANFYGNMAYTKEDSASGNESPGGTIVVHSGMLSICNSDISENIVWAKSDKGYPSSIVSTDKLSLGVDMDNSVVKITNNKIIGADDKVMKSAGAIGCASGCVSIGGSIKITGNTANDVEQNFARHARATDLISVQKALSDDSEIGIGCIEYNGITELYEYASGNLANGVDYDVYHAGVKPSTFFKSDSEGFKVIMNNGDVQFVSSDFHEHDWSVPVVSEDKTSISKTCVANGCTVSSGAKQSLVLTGTDKDYDGQASVVTASKNGWDTPVGAVQYYRVDETNAILETLGETAPQNAGRYVGKVTVGSNTLEKYFTIRKAEVTSSMLSYLAPSNLQYNGQKKVATITAASGITGLGEITVVYHKGSMTGEVVDAENVTEVGTYYVSADVADGDNNTSTCVSSPAWTFTIVPKTITGTVSITGTVKYGAELTATFSEADETVTYEWYRSGSSSVIGTQSTYTLGVDDIGHTLTAKAYGTGNYTGTATSEVSEVVVKGDATDTPGEVVYEIDYINETITPYTGYEISSVNDSICEPVSDLTDYIGGTVYIRKVETATNFASDWTPVSIPARVDAPALNDFTLNAETIMNKADASLSGVMNGMEYVIGELSESNSWVDGAGEVILNPENTTILVRVKATASSFCSEATVVEFAPSTKKITVKFDGIETTTEVAYNGTIEVPEEEPTKTRYVFAGWYKDKACKKAWNFVNDTVTDEMTLYPKWEREDVPIYIVNGKVVMENSDIGIDGVKLDLRRGSNTYATTTSANGGQYDFLHVTPGDYNLVASYNGKVKTIIFTITEEDLNNRKIELPIHDLSSKIEVAEEAPEVIVDGLDVIAKSKESVSQDVEIVFNVEGRSENVIDEAEVTAIKEEAKGKKLTYLDMFIEHFINDVKQDNITDTNGNVLEIVIPYNMSGKNSFVIYRYHDDKATVMTALSERPVKGDEGYADGNCFIGKNFIVVYATKFSTYAIGYRDDEVYYPSVSSGAPSDDKKDETTEKTPEEQHKEAVAEDLNKKIDATTASEILNSVSTSNFTKMQPIVKKNTNTTITLGWKAQFDADGYMIYGNKCNTSNKKYSMKLMKTVGADQLTQSMKSLTIGTYYKYQIVAYKLVNGERIAISKTPVIHTITKGGKYGVAKSVRIDNIAGKEFNSEKTVKFSLTKGKTAQIKATEIKEDKPIKQHRALTFETSNKNIATVDAKGKITAKKKGTCEIYIYAQNGVYNTVTITVK